MAKSWYVLHTYSGYENKIEKQIRKLMEQNLFDGAVCDIRIPSEEVVEIKDGKKKIQNRKSLPGYILLEMDLPDLGWKQVVALIRKIDGVTGFLGSSNNLKPRPISSDEVKSLLNKGTDSKAEKNARIRSAYAEGEQVKIIDGPFDTFTGKIEEVNVEKGKLRVMVGIFGRSTPVEVDFDQVEKV